MKAFKITALFLLILLALVIIVSLLLPPEAQIQRTTSIQAKPRQVFRLVSNLKSWKLWSPWQQLDTSMAITYSEIEEGAGASFSWDSKNPKLGKGTLTVSEAVPFDLVRTEMVFEGKGVAKSSFLIEPSGTSVKLTWTLTASTEHVPFLLVPVVKVMNLFLDRMAGPELDKGIANLKKIAEMEKEITIAGFDAEFRDFPGLYYVGIRNKLLRDEIKTRLTENYALLTEYLQNSNEKQIGPPFTVNYSSDGTSYDIEAGLGTSQSLPSIFPIISEKLEPSRVLVVKYYGPYSSIGRVYSESLRFIDSNRLKLSGPPVEYYFTDPVSEPDSSRWLTEVSFPVIPVAIP